MKRISRELAMASVARELGDQPCLMCALRAGTAGPRIVLFEDEHATALVSRYALRWGHVIVLSNQHAESYRELPPAAWAAAALAAQRAARALERELAPLRVYVASLGAPADVGVPMTSKHLHFNVVPLFDAADKPSTVLTWSQGVIDAADTELMTLRDRLVAALGRES